MLDQQNTTGQPLAHRYILKYCRGMFCVENFSREIILKVKVPVCVNNFFWNPNLRWKPMLVKIMWNLEWGEYYVHCRQIISTDQMSTPDKPLLFIQTNRLSLPSVIRSWVSSSLLKQQQETGEKWFSSWSINWGATWPDKSGNLIKKNMRELLAKL